jgi:hypothetical protein
MNSKVVNLICFISLISNFALGQISTKVDSIMFTNHFSKDIKNSASVNTRRLVKKSNQHNLLYSSNIIGTTDYDLQTNAEAYRRIINYGSSQSAVWTFTPVGADWTTTRGTGYNHRIGQIWNPPPVNEIESVRTGYPTILNLGNKEGVICHKNSNSISYFSTNSSTGSNIFSGNVTTANWNNYLWPQAANFGNNIYFLDHSSTNTFCDVRYSRSVDGGVTWVQDHDSIPTLDSSLMSSNPTFFLDARGNFVAFVTGGYGNPLVLWKSSNSGVSFNRTIIDSLPGIAFPAALNGLMDPNNDGIPDTALINGGGVTCLIDNNNQVHVWYTAYKVATNMFY